MSRLSDLRAESSSAGDSMCESVPESTSSLSIDAAACTIAGVPISSAHLLKPPSSIRRLSASAPDLPSMQTHAISSRLRRSTSEIATVPPEAPITSYSST